MLKQVLYFGSPLKLNMENRQLKIKQQNELKEEIVTTRPLEDIGCVIIDSPRITISGALLSSLIGEGIAIIVCDEKHHPSGLMLNLVGNSLQAERFHCQLEASVPLKKRLWQQTVTAKIQNQASVLFFKTGIRHLRMTRLSSQIKSGDPDNVEAKAAAYYWKHLWEENPEFHRDRYGAEPNSLLNYGYAILRAIVCRALVSSGMHPTLGIFHKNKYNPYCLADDIMEPYRPYVDLLVTEIMSSVQEASIDDKEIKRKLLSIPALDVIIDGKTRPLMVGISETTASLYRCFNGESRKIKYPLMEMIFQ